jgi:CBS domain-containing protein
MSSNVLVKDIMTKNVPVVHNETTMQEVVDMMVKDDLSYMMVEMQVNQPAS